MGITPINDAMGLADRIFSSPSGPKQPPESGDDFKAVWNEQAKSGKRPATENSSQVYADSYKDIRKGNKRNDISDKSQSASQTDVRSRESSETASERNEKISDKGKMLTDEEIVSAQETLSTAAMELENRLADILNIRIISQNAASQQF